MISIMADNKPVGIEWLEFSDGALTCKIDPSIKDVQRYISLNVDTKTPVKQVLEEVRLVISAFKEMGVPMVTVNLNLPYLPYGRADRVFEQGNPNSLEAFFLGLSDYRSWIDRIYIYDPHNEDALKRVNRECKNFLIDPFELEIIRQEQCFRQSLPFNTDVSQWDYVIAPDKGAVKKSQAIANFLGVPVIIAGKKRDISTGRIVESTLDSTLPAGSRVIVCDDILDYGGTFVPLAKKLKSQGCVVDLYVTHLIAAGGLSRFEGLIDRIYNLHTVGNFINRSDVSQFNEGNYARSLETR